MSKVLEAYQSTLKAQEAVGCLAGELQSLRTGERVGCVAVRDKEGRTWES